MSDADTTLVLHPELYAFDAVQQSAEAFAALASFEVARHGDGDDTMIHVVIRDPRPDVRDRIVDEFYNHALHGTIVARQESRA